MSRLARWVTFADPRQDVRWPHVLACVAVLVVVAAFIFPIRASDGQNPGVTCLSNLKQVTLTALLYNNDYDGRYPPANVWYDLEGPYRKAWLRCPEIPEKLEEKPTVGYAMNLWLDRVPETCIADPVKTILKYDSTSLLPNASDPVTSLVEGGRHHGHNNLGYTDGHAKSIAWSDQAGIRNPRIDSRCFLTGKPARSKT